ncbi:MAG: hypothetical protein R3C11_22770 [Planctomycetaceae bacterium]
MKNKDVYTLSVSHGDAKLIQQHLSVPMHRLNVIYHGVNSRFERQDHRIRTLSGPDCYGWGRPYLRKNLQVLLLMMPILRQKHQLQSQS